MTDRCRICLTQIGKLDQVSISMKVVEETVLELITLCAPVQIFEGDMLPKFVCVECYAKLKDFREFRNLIITSDMTLKEKLLPSFPACHKEEQSDQIGSDDQQTTAVENNMTEIVYCDKLSQLKDECEKDFNNFEYSNPENSSNIYSDDEHTTETKNNIKDVVYDKLLEPKEEFVKDSNNFEHSNPENSNYIYSDDKQTTESKNNIKEVVYDKLAELKEECVDSSNFEYSNPENSSGILEPHILHQQTNTDKQQRSTQVKKIYECKECNKIYKSRGGYNVHMTKHTGEKNYACEYCPKKFTRRSAVMYHTRIHTGEKPHTCDICFMSFVTPSSYYVHRKIHNGERKFKCTLCPESFIQSQSLEIHVRRIHTGERPYMCEICSSTFRSDSSLFTHKQNVHQSKEPCPICNNMYSSRILKAHLRRHQEKEDGIKRFVCDQCGKGFTCSSSRKKHLLIHSGEKPFSCEVCNKAFNQKSSLKTHMKIHSDVTPFECDHCMKSFKYKHNLQSHLQTHRKEKLDDEISSNDSSSVVVINKMTDHCRICLIQIGKLDQVSISMKVVEETVLELIILCASIKVFEEDMLPKVVCVECFAKLKDFREFRNTIINSDITLKEKLSQSLLACHKEEQSDQIGSDVEQTTAIENNMTEIVYCDKLSQVKDECEKDFNNFQYSNPENSSYIYPDDEHTTETKINIKEVVYDKLSELKEECVEDSSNFEHSNPENSSDILEPQNLDQQTNKDKQQRSTQVKKIYECKECNKIYKTTDGYNIHMAKHTGEKTYVCEYCPKKFTRRALGYHRRIHTGEKPHTCDICFISFATPSNYYRHRKIHNGERKFKCTLCPESFVQSQSLVIHVRKIHTGERPYMCEICSSTFRCRGTLLSHKQDVHQSKEPCPICNNMYSSRFLKAHLRRHQEKEEGIKRFVCDQCGKGFTCRSSRKRHLLIHSGEKAFSCEICNHAFTQKSALKTHMRIHSDVKPFECDHCTKSFRYKHNLQSHLQTHRKEKLDDDIISNDSNSLVT
ncbi:zinc finger protein 271-like [Cylas formicarius]|uniref:zinc finger protein 271-like n=1 Tax=Cylas formicarius TaxID=197179 RepID=UPI002958DD90|nr:zinc finger protein 271-like [Cylas formicarius]